MTSERAYHVHRVARRDGRSVEEARNDDRGVTGRDVDRHPRRVIVIRRHVYGTSGPKGWILRMAEIRIQSLLCNPESARLQLLVIDGATLTADKRQAGHDGDGNYSDRYQRRNEREAATVPYGRIW
jgi:hypothetical protein